MTKAIFCWTNERTRELKGTPSLRGVVNKISHLVHIIEERG